MAPLLCPSPIILDQSFPRNQETLTQVSVALGRLQSDLESRKVDVVLTPTLQLFIEDFDWSALADFPDLRDIHSLLVQWFLQPHDGLLVVDLSRIQSGYSHPVPSDCDVAGNLELWSDEVGDLLTAHNDCCPGKPFIGIACHHAYGGMSPSSYDRPGEPAFPLVGPANLSILGDAYEWEIDTALMGKPVRFVDAKKFVYVLGATEVKKPTHGSHYKVHFPGANRPWILDYNEDPLKDKFVGQIEALVDYPFQVIKTVLIKGKFPVRTCRLKRSGVLTD